MNRDDVIARLKSTEATMRAQGVAALFLFGSFARDEASAESDVDIFVDAGNDAFYDLSNFMGAYEAARTALPGRKIGYSTRAGLSKHVRSRVEREAIRVF